MDWDLTDTTITTGGDERRDAGSRQPPNGASEQEKNMSLALHHANLIQQRKDIEKSVLDSLIKLIDYPSSKEADSEKPSLEDAAAVKKHLRLFQPSDFDELIQERNIEKQCGYVLCPKPHRPIGRVGELTILLKGRDLQVVKTSEVMRWCSDDCAKRAMFLRVQLSDIPAWERLVETKLELSGEDPTVEPEASTAVDREAVAQIAEDLKKLALERGNPSASVDKVMTDVQEKSYPHR